MIISRTILGAHPVVEQPSASLGAREQYWEERDSSAKSQCPATKVPTYKNAVISAYTVRLDIIGGYWHQQHNLSSQKHLAAENGYSVFDVVCSGSISSNLEYLLSASHRGRSCGPLHSSNGFIGRSPAAIQYGRNLCAIDRSVLGPRSGSSASI
jgi:hypothetical protein